MKVGLLDNRIILYLEGNENLEKLRKLLKKSQIKGVPTDKLVDMLYSGVNVIPTIGVWQDETDPSQYLISNYELDQYRAMVANWHREWVKDRKAQGEIYGTRKQREYAARSAAYERVGRPKNIDWTKPKSIKIPKDLKKEFGLDR